MPELPEVETIRRGLREKISGLVLSQIKVRTKVLLRSNQEWLERECRGKKVLDVMRRGKYLGLKLEGERTLWFHLGMTGQILISSKGALEERDPHTHAMARFRGTGMRLVFRDVRKFGHIFMTHGRTEVVPGPKGLGRLGPEPFEMSEAEFTGRFKSSRGKIKGLLLNQSFMAGLGNIYADESLHRSGIRPTRPASLISKARFAALRQAVHETLEEAIRSGGSSIDDYRNVDGARGGFQNFHRVYGREGKPCLACGTSIQRVKISGRSSFYCPKCQK